MISGGTGSQTPQIAPDCLAKEQPSEVSQCDAKEEQHILSPDAYHLVWVQIRFVDYISSNHWSEELCDACSAGNLVVIAPVSP